MLFLVELDHVTTTAPTTSAPEERTGDVPAPVLYSLTTYGRSVLPIAQAVRSLGTRRYRYFARERWGRVVSHRCSTRPSESGWRLHFVRPRQPSFRWSSPFCCPLVLDSRRESERYASTW